MTMSADDAATGSKPENRLAAEKSPYLLQHRHNPVNWYPWGPEAFAAAVREQKPIFLSIGYSTCYWCHVMERESFERDDVAAALNASFVSIKVDREERPDVDQIYMDAIVGLTGQGGWPMSVFLTSEGQPFWGGTYFPRQHFLAILANIAAAWQRDRQEIFAAAQRITDFLKERERLPAAPPATDKDSLGLSAAAALTAAEDDAREQLRKIMRAAHASYVEAFDDTYGGFGSAPKFPPSTQIRFLLRAHRRFEDQHALGMALTTLERMARGGLFDHLGGGFHRYSTDERWLVPHFEKMLYDNALLAMAYLEAYQLTKNEMFSAVARATLNYVIRDMTDSAGGFYSAQDAGEVGKEGEYYVWSEKELREILTAEEFAVAQDVFSITTQGNFEHGTTILTLNERHPWSIYDDATMRSIRRKLLEHRARRAAPHLDDKVLSAWNGLMISAFARGFQVLGDEDYLRAAQRAANFIRTTLFQQNQPGQQGQEKQLLRRYRAGDAAIPAFLEDYAFLIEGLIELYQADFDSRWFEWAMELQAIQDRQFWDAESRAYNFSVAPDILVRRKDLVDGATPSGNTTALVNLLRIYAFTAMEQTRERATSLLSTLDPILSKAPEALPKALQAIDLVVHGQRELAIIAADNDGERRQALEMVQRNFYPEIVVAAARPRKPDANEAQPIAQSVPLLQDRLASAEPCTIYLCQGQSCRRPVRTAEELKALLRKDRY